VISALTFLFLNALNFPKASGFPIWFYMSDKKTPKLTREERLAANLRANLRRRKAVVRKKADEAKPDSDNSGKPNA
jgi:hypothetical protein